MTTMLEDIAVTDPVLTTPPVPETDYPAWNAATNYTLATRVIRTSTHRIYENLIAGVNASTPESAPTRWLDVGPTNARAMFDDAVGTVTQAGAPTMSWAMSPAAVIDTLALLDVSASTARAVMVIPGPVTVFDRTISLENSATVTDEWEWCFGQIVRRSTAVFNDLPPYADGVLTVTLTDISNVSCGTCRIGSTFFIGVDDFGARAGIVDSSVVSTDAFAVTTVVERPFRKRTVSTITVDNIAFDEVLRRLSLARAKPRLYIGANGLYDAFLVFGIFKSLEVELEHVHESVCSLEILGMNG